MEDTESCSICCCEFNRTTRKAITCPIATCRQICCQSCLRRHILSGADEAPCIFCKNNLDHGFISENTPRSFFGKEWLEHCANVMISRQKGLLPATQIEVERVKEEKKLTEEYVDVTQQLRTRERTFYIQIEKTKIAPLQRQISDLQKQVQDLRRLQAAENNEDIWRLRQHQIYIAAKLRNPPTKVVKKFIQACPVERCRGFLSTAWKCGICNSFICPDCHVVKQDRQDSDHICDNEIKATIAMIKNETKPCPNCAQAIFKIDGCDQMWCTQCHTAFSWRTGQKVSGRVHNPHFIQFEREGGRLTRTPGDIPCGGPPHVRILDHWSVIRSFQGFPSVMQGTFIGWKFFNYIRMQPLYNGTAGPHDRGTSYQIIGSRTYMPFPTEFPISLLGSSSRIHCISRLLGLVVAIIGTFEDDETTRPIFGVIGRREIRITERNSDTNLTNDDLLPIIRILRNLRQFRDRLIINIEDAIMPLEDEDRAICTQMGLPYLGMEFISPFINQTHVYPEFFDGSFNVGFFDTSIDQDRFKIAQCVINACRLIPHVTDIMLHRFTTEQEPVCRQLRIDYLTGVIDEDRWRSRLKAVSKKVLKNRDVTMILDMVSVTLTDILQRYVSAGEIDISIELETLRKYSNQQFQLISKRFGNVVPTIRPLWAGFTSDHVIDH